MIAGARPLAAVYEDLIDVLRDTTRTCGLRGTERDIVRAYLEVREAFADQIPCSEADLVVSEMALRYGRADLVIFHSDGSASVIEAKDGAKGYAHVVAGIGQAGLYATQLAMARSLKAVRRCLLWGSTGDLRADATIGAACDAAGVARIVLPPAHALVGLNLMWGPGGQATEH